MTPILSSIYDGWNFLFNDLSDERTRGWFLVGSPIPILFIMYAYSKLIKQIGPKFMENRPPFQIDKIVQVYNIIQVLLCGWLTYESFSITFGPNGYYSWSCQPMDKSLSPVARRVATLTWSYYMIKVFDLLDTIFFVMRKKFNQVSFLHYYHHMGVLILGYMGSTYYPDGQGFIIVPLNSFVHCFMYTYYFLTNYNPKYREKIWWKKHITQLQIAQFLLILVQMSKTFIVSECAYPRFPVVLMLPQIALILWLFGDFYYKAYIRPKTHVKAQN